MLLCSRVQSPIRSFQRRWRLALCHTRLPVSTRGGLITCAAGEGGSGGEELESMFQKELERRKAGGGSAPPPPPPPPSFARSRDGPEVETPPQLAQSRALNSEGLEGLIPRATELIKLGLAFTGAFGPFAVGVALAFWAIYSVFGDAFIHGGRPDSTLPAYVDPELLLADPGPPMVPFTEGVFPAENLKY